MISIRTVLELGSSARQGTVFRPGTGTVMAKSAGNGNKSGTGIKPGTGLNPGTGINLSAKSTQKNRRLPQISNLGLFFLFFSVFPFWPMLTGLTGSF